MAYIGTQVLFHLIVIHVYEKYNYRDLDVVDQASFLKLYPHY